MVKSDYQGRSYDQNFSNVWERRTCVIFISQHPRVITTRLHHHRRRQRRTHHRLIWGKTPTLTLVLLRGVQPSIKPEVPDASSLVLPGPLASVRSTHTIMRPFLILGEFVLKVKYPKWIFKTSVTESSIKFHFLVPFGQVWQLISWKKKQKLGLGRHIVRIDLSSQQWSSDQLDLDQSFWLF